MGFRGQEKVQRVATKRRDKNGKVVAEPEALQDPKGRRGSVWLSRTFGSSEP